MHGTGTDHREERAERAIDLSPAAIARHPALTVREKLELLEDMKLQLDAAPQSSAALGFGTPEVDRAIDELRVQVEAGRTPATPMPVPGGRH